MKSVPFDRRASLLLQARGRGEILGIGEIELQGDAVGIANEYLLHVAPGYIDHAVLDAGFFKPGHGVGQAFRFQGNVIQRERIVNGGAAVVGNAHMQYRVPAGVEPHTWRIERRAIAYLESEHLSVELAQSVEVPGANIEMIDAVDAHSRCRGRSANSIIGWAKVYPGGTAESESSMRSMSNLHIDPARLMARIAALGAIGATAEGGVGRLALSDEDGAGRDQVVAWMRAAGLQVEIDQIGNIFGTRAGTADAAPVMTGSHVDSVANGGKLDGAYGVLAGIEVVETLNDAHIETTRPIVVAAFSNEEGARFQPDMMGSLVYAGGLAIETALETQDNDGVAVAEALTRIGYAGEREVGACPPCAFVEAHIEQGPVLEAQAVTIGAVENLQGISWSGISISGQANHAGTTPMTLRHDAGYCAGEIASRVRRLATDLGGQQVATVGVIDLQPGLVNVIPAKAFVTVDLRNTDNEMLKHAEKLLDDFLDSLAASEGVHIELQRLARFDPVCFDESIAARIEKNAAALGFSCQRMTSGAGHDAQMMARLCPAAMIFVPSVEGISHNPAEYTHAEDLSAGANVLLHTLLELAST